MKARSFTRPRASYGGEACLDPPLERRREKREHKAGHDEPRHDEIGSFAIRARQLAAGENGERGSAPRPPRAAAAHGQDAGIVFLGFLIASYFLAKARMNLLTPAESACKTAGASTGGRLSFKSVKMKLARISWLVQDSPPAEAAPRTALHVEPLRFQR
jgi:hypothetical protein